MGRYIYDIYVVLLTYLLLIIMIRGIQQEISPGEDEEIGIEKEKPKKRVS